MNQGFRGWARPRHKVFVSEPVTINTTSGNTFLHGFGRVPGDVVVRLRCATANNGYVAGDEIPLESVWRQGGTPDDGAAYRTVRINGSSILAWLGSGNYAFFAATAAPITANVVNITLSQWRFVVRCADIERSK